MPVDIRRGPISLQPVDVLEPDPTQQNPDDYGWWNGVGDQYAIGVWGQMKDAYEELFVRNATRVPGFDGLDNIPDGYVEYADAYAYAQSPEEVAKITSNIEETLAARERLGQQSLAANLTQGLFAGIFDPINLVAGPTLKGVGFFKGAMRSGVAFGGLNAGQELVRHSLDPTSTVEETTTNIGFGVAFAGLIGGGIGHFTKGANVSGRVGEPARARAEEAGDAYARTLNTIDGIVLGDRDIIDFNGQGVKIIDGPTGKIDANGRPVRAFFRKKETFEKIARDKAVAKAADDLLGDVIPEGSTPRPERPDITPEDFNLMAREAIREGGEQADEADVALPFGREEGETVEAPRAADEAEEFEDTIFVDTAAIRAEFAEKPWTNPRHPGIEPLPADAFKSEAEWLNFVVLHELHHKTTKRLDGETMVDYENRTNRLAFESLQASKGPLSPSRGMLESLALWPLPEGRMDRIAKNIRSAHQHMQSIGGDMATQKVANQLGAPTTPGGSVFQRSLRWFNNYYVGMRAIRSGWLRHLNGAAPRSGAGETLMMGKAMVTRQAKRANKLTYAEWNQFVGRAMFDDEPFQINGKAISDEDFGIVREAAQQAREAVFVALGNRARDLQMFDAQFRLKKEIGRRTKKIEDLEARLDRVKGKGTKQFIEDEITMLRSEIDEMAPLLDELTTSPLKPRGDDANYFSRVYNVQAIKDRYDDFVELLAQGFVKEGRQADEVGDEVGAIIPAEKVDQHAFKTGEPVSLESFHGTHLEIPDFDPALRGRSTGASDAKQAFFFTSREKTAKYYADLAVRERTPIYRDETSRAKAKGETLPAEPRSTINRRHVVLKNPFVVDMKGKVYDGDRFDAALQKAKTDGHDGVIFRNTYDSGSYGTVGRVLDGRFKSETIIAAFEPENVRFDAPASSLDAARLRAKDVADNIIGEGGQDPEVFGTGGIRNLRSRQIPLTNKELADFIVLDAGSVMYQYVRRMGAAVEMQAMYGSRTAAEAFDEVTLEMLEAGKTPAQIRTVLNQLEDTRDRVLGTFHTKDPLSWDNRTARLIKNFGHMTLMGRSIFAQVVDMARTMAVEGYAPLFQALSKVLDDGFKGVELSSDAKAFGEALEMSNAHASARLMEGDSAVLVTNGTKLERMAAQGSAAMYTANLMNPWVVGWKELTSMMSAHRLLGEVDMLAKAIRSGKTIATLSKSEQRTMARLASWGIDVRTAQMIADMPTETTAGGLRLANLSKWKEQGAAGEKAYEAFGGALSGNIRTNVVTPGPTQRPAIFDGIFRVNGKRVEWPLIGPAAQLLSFPWAASAKIGHAIASGRDPHRGVTMASLMVGGYVSAWLAAGDRWEMMDWKERVYAAIDRSGMTLWMGSVTQRIEGLTGYGPRASLGLYEFGEGEVSDEVGDVAGPASSVIAGGIEAFASDDMEDQRRADLWRRMVPFSGLLWWDETMKDLSDKAAATGMIDIDTGGDFGDDEVAVALETVE